MHTRQAVRRGSRQAMRVVIITALLLSVASSAWGDDTATFLLPAASTGAQSGIDASGVVLVEQSHTDGCSANDDCPPGHYCAGPGCDDPGECVLRPEMCYTLYAPVCGCDGRTYSNGCVAAAHGIRVAADDPCHEELVTFTVDHTAFLPLVMTNGEGPPPTATPTATFTPTPTAMPTAIPTATITPTPIPAGPQPPQRLSPSEGETLSTISPDFVVDNQHLDQPARTQVQVAADLVFSLPDVNFVTSAFRGISTVILLYNLQPGTTYYWRVCSGYDSRAWGPWSALWSFTTASEGTLPDAPTLIEPVNGSTVATLRPTLRWSEVAGADHYAVGIGETADGITAFLTGTTQFTPHSDLEPGSAYRWFVWARNGYGWGPYSETWNFRTED